MFRTDTRAAKKEGEVDKGGPLFCLFSYPAALLLGIGLSLLKRTGRLKVVHQERIPAWQRNLILACNHPSLLEPFLIPPLFLREYVLRPSNFLPWSVADKGNFYDPWYFFWLRPRLIPLERGASWRQKYSQVTALRKMQNVLEGGGRIVIFPEGTRTFKAILNGGVRYSKTGKVLGKLSSGAAGIALRCTSTVVPVWIEGSERVLPSGRFPLPLFWKHRIRITIGEPLSFPKDATLQEATEKLARALLELADAEA